MGPNKPLILAGHGVRASGNFDRFHEWIERVQWPVVTTNLATDLMPWDHPLYVGHPGIKGDRAGNLAVQNCTQLFILGCSQHSTTTGYNKEEFAPKAYKQVMDWSFPHLVMTQDLHWLERCQEWKKTLMVRDEPHDRSQLNYYDVIEALSQACTGEETIVTDSGMSYYITGQAWRTKKGQRLILPGALAQMGYCLPAVTGACFGAPGRTVIGIVGDGGFQTNIHELGVIALHKLNAKILVMNNGGYACIRNTQRNYFEKPYSGTDRESGVGYPETEAIARAYGIPYRSCYSDLLLETVLQDFMGFGGPVILEVFTHTEQEFMPVVKSYRQADGTMSSGKLEEMWPERTPRPIGS